MVQKKSVLVAPLDWGLGHAARCIPLIDAFQRHRWEVHIAAPEPLLNFLVPYFPAAPHHTLPAYDITYDRKGRQVSAVARQLPRLIKVIRKEQLETRRLHRKYSFQALISDHRYGVHGQGVPSIFLAHQLALRLPAQLKGFESGLHVLHARFLRRFDQIWIPDISGEKGLAGSLTTLSTVAPKSYIGWLSRFSQPIFSPQKSQLEKGGVVALISGPEPQRSQFETLLRKQLSLLDTSSILIGGRRRGSIEQDNHLTVIPFLDGPELAETLQRAEVVVARPGYSSLMDFAALGLRKLLLVPTPGQTEQLYLANRLAQQNAAHVVPQEQLDVKRGLAKAHNYHFTPATEGFDYSLLNEAIRNL